MTPAEKRLVARRAYGEYAVQSNCERIWRHRDKAECSVYIDLLAVACSGRKETFAEWKVVAEPVIALHPDPWGTRERKRDIKPANPAPDVLAPEVSADPPKKAGRGLAALKRALSAPWPTRGPSSKVGDQQEEAS